MLSAQFELQILVIVVITLLVIFLYSKLNKSQNNLKEITQEKLNLQTQLLNETNKNKDITTELAEFKDKFSDVFDRESCINDLDIEIENKKNEITLIKSSYRDKKTIFEMLKKEAAIYDETIELAELGFYKPSFNFEHSEKYKDEITKNKGRQKQLVNDKKAVFCTTEWSVEGSKAKGRTMTNKNIKMTARAFNNECDSAIAKVKWNNATRMIERINKAFKAINQLNTSNVIIISNIYLELKIEELKLTHEYHERKQQEKEEQAEIRERIREEAKLEKELAEAAKEEGKYQSLLEKAKKQAEKSTGEKLSKLEEHIAKLTSDLETAHSKTERAKSMAEQTKVGHVYVISNIGSFGQDVYKIGMTRRLEPLDRVKELGDASVPFRFDVHAMIYTENAPELEKALHIEFEERRLNLVNNRKEFFNINLKEIERVVKEKNVEAEFYLTAEAREYQESKAIREQKNEIKENNIEYPEYI